jgi:hypothetical protein
VISRPIVRRFGLLIVALLGLTKVASADTLRIGGIGAATVACGQTALQATSNLLIAD